MPVGNGEIVANVWVDGVANGSLALLFGRSDAFSGDGQPMKLSRLRIELQPNPFGGAGHNPGGCATGEPYQQHPGYIGDQGHFDDPAFACSSAATCPAEAQDHCDALPGCKAFALDPDWNEGRVAELFSVGLEGAQPNPAWTLWTRNCSGGGGHGSMFRQELDLLTGAVTISSGSPSGSTASVNVSVRVWSDATGLGTDDSVYVEVASSVPTSASVYFDSWRTAAFQQTTKSTARGPCEAEITVLPDSFASAGGTGLPANGLATYRINNHSMFNKTMSDQMLGLLAQRMADPLLGRASGLLATAVSGAGRPFVRTNATHMASPGLDRNHTITVHAHTATGCADDDTFLQQLYARARESKRPADAWGNHTAWWEAFWQRSWVSLTNSSVVPPANASTSAAAAVSQAHYLQRYLMAIQSRGALPVHHNGGTVTWGWNGTSHANPDERPWGGGYW